MAPVHGAVLGTIGSVEVACVLDGHLSPQPMDHWYPDFDRAQVEPHLSWLAPVHCDPAALTIPLPVHSFLLTIGRLRILIDSCVGNHKDRPGIAGAHQVQTDYLARLAGLGVAPDDIDYVLCTHLHFDHVGWNTRLVDGRWRPTFPNARFVFAQAEFDAAKAQAEDGSGGAAAINAFRDSIAPIMDAGRGMLVRGVHDVLDGLTLRPAPGHSPGHIRIELWSAGQRGVFAGDLLHSPVQIPLWQWSSRYCWDGPMAARSRFDLLEFCAAHDALLLPGHFATPHVARIREVDGGFLPEFGWWP